MRTYTIHYTQNAKRFRGKPETETVDASSYKDEGEWIDFFEGKTPVKRVRGANVDEITSVEGPPDAPPVV